MRKAAKRICIVFLLTALSLCAPAQAESPYDGSLADAQVLIRIPALRQYGGYTCGTTCVQMLMNWLFPYEGDLNLAAYEEALGTTEDAGTPPESIVRFLAESGVAKSPAQAPTTRTARFIWTDALGVQRQESNETTKQKFQEV